MKEKDIKVLIKLEKKKKKKVVVKGHLAVPINTTLYDILCFLSPHQSMSH